MRIRLSMLLVLLLTACTNIPFLRRPDDTQTKQSGFAWKRVVEKREPAYLIADDGSECVVSEKRFRETQIGKKVLCMWGNW